MFSDLEVDYIKVSTLKNEILALQQQNFNILLLVIIVHISFYYKMFRSKSKKSTCSLDIFTVGCSKRGINILKIVFKKF